MSKLLKYSLSLFFAIFCTFGLSAKSSEITTDNYRRSSLCSFLISRADQSMYERIQQSYLEIPTPDQYNSHDLSVRVINVDKKGEYGDSISDWLNRHQIGSRLVAKWFDRDILTGECSMDLVKTRGMYNASELDREIALRTPRGFAMLEDAGEDLIGNTFVLVHEAHYIDNAKRSKNVGTGLRIFGALAGVVLGSSVSDLFDTFADITETIKGFRVKFHTRLYQLEWNDDVAGRFYQDLYSSVPDSQKQQLFEQNRDLFTLKYIGEVTSSGSKTSFLGISEEHPDIMIRKACQRAIDDNVRDLQKEFEVFRVKSPILAVNGKDVDVAIGMKEGVNQNSEYEVLEIEESDGKTKYKRVGIIKPVPGRIWDNRYMAYEEGAVGADLRATTFRVKSGKTPYEGLLVRQIK